MGTHVECECNHDDEVGDAVGDDVEAADLAQRVEVLDHVGRLVLGPQQGQRNPEVVPGRPKHQRAQEWGQQAVGVEWQPGIC